jgi:response regulator RpfG family c-di-GMP phosphodiesterase
MKILVAEDEKTSLLLLKQFLTLMNHEPVCTENGEDAWSAFQAGAFPVVITDWLMPGMDGLELCRRIRSFQRETYSYIIVLTAKSSRRAQLSAMHAGADDFLAKSFDREQLSARLVVAERMLSIQEQLASKSRELQQSIAAEKELLEKTLHGSIKVVTETLSLVNSVAFGRTSRLQRYVHLMVTKLKLQDAWKYELAAMLSQIGCVTLSTELLEKVYAGGTLSDKEHQLFVSHPSVGSSLLAKIPRLEAIAAMVDRQQQSYSDHLSTPSADPMNEEIALGAQLLKVALDFDAQLQRGNDWNAALQSMWKMPGAYNPTLLGCLDTLEVSEGTAESRTARVRDLQLQMILDDDVRAKSGLLLLKKGQEITTSALIMLRRFANGIGVIEPLRVRVPPSEPAMRRQPA